MRKRPLCFVCITLILIMWMLQTSKGAYAPSEAVDLPEAASVYGSVYRCENKDNHQILYLRQAVLSADSQKQKLDHVRITCDKMASEYQVSDLVCAKGTLNQLKGATNPGQFDVRNYYYTQKVSYIMWEPALILLERPEFSLGRSLEKLRQALAGQYDKMLPNQYGALLKGITLGDKSGLPKETEALFQTGGISHILAISGLHLQILGNGVYGGLRKCRMPITGAALLSGGILICYGILTGGSVATLRALIMFLLSTGAQITGRTYDGMTGMALAAVVLVAGNPAYVSYSGFWLSYIAVCSFLIFKEKRKLAGGILLYAFMAPIMLNYFYEIPLYSIFINLFVVPTIGFVLVSGMLGCVLGFVSLTLGKLAMFPAVLLLHIYKVLCEVSKILPSHTMVFGKPGWMQIIMYYALMGMALYFFRKNRIKKIRFVAFLFMIPAWLILTCRSMDGLQVTMLDVGQGDCLVLQTETGNTYLIDGGSTSEENVAEYRIWPFLKYSGVDTIKAVFLTHADGDHMNGIMALLEMMEQGMCTLQIEKIVLPDWSDMSAFSEIYEMADRCQVELYQMARGGSFTDGALHMTCIHPNGEDYQENLNEGSLVLQLEYGDFSMLFTGDLEGHSEDVLLGNYQDTDVLKVAHHGSRNSTGEAFLKEVKPEICLISCGENNGYGHPHRELLERLEDIGASVFQTSVHGALTIRTDGEKIDLKTYKQYNINRR